MFERIEVLNYRSLRYVDQRLESFAVLVGPNASGKSTFLDVPAFLAQLVRDGLEATVAERADSLSDLVWMRDGHGFSLAVEARVPARLRAVESLRQFATVRYQVEISDQGEGAPSIRSESLTLLPDRQAPPLGQVHLFPAARPAPARIGPERRQKEQRTVLGKSTTGVDNYYSELYRRAGGGWNTSLKLGPQRTALGNVPEDPTKFPVAMWFRDLLLSGVQSIVLNSQLIRRPSPPLLRSRGFRPDGSNLPWVVDELAQRDPGHLRRWIAQVTEALPDLVDVTTTERPEDRHRYLRLHYRNGLIIPSWTASDGTLRLLALTILPYLPEFSGVYLIEEPENGIHPQAVELVSQSLSSVYDAQILVATHSPVFLGRLDAQNVLCFAKTADGATDVVRGDQHPRLADWQRDIDLGTLFAAGVLG